MSIFRQATVTAVATLTVQVSTFAVQALAPWLLSDVDFARLTVIIAATMLGSAFCDFGLGLTATRFYGQSRDERFLIGAFRLRLLCLPLAAVTAAVLLGASLIHADIALAIVASAVLSLWNGARSADQARQDYRSFARASLLFSVLRTLCGLGALVMFRDPVAVAIGLYVLPMPAMLASESWALVLRAFRDRGRDVLAMLRYSFPVYINALIFIGLPYIPQFVIAARLDAQATGTYGLITTFTAPLSLVVYSLRSVLLPRMLGDDGKIEAALWSPRGFVTIGFIAVAAGLVGLCVAQGLGLVYGTRFPELRQGFALFFAGFAFTACLGIFSLSIHTLGVPRLGMWLSLPKIVAMAGALTLFGDTLTEVITITILIMIAGEGAQTAILWRKR